MSHSAPLIPLSSLARELIVLTGRSPGYQTLYRELVSGTVPAHKVGDRWFIKRTDLRVIADALGLTASEAA